MVNVDRQYIEWLRQNAPGILSAYKRRYGPLAQIEAEPETFADKLMAFANGFVQYRQQRDILKAQTQRMKAGQPPLETSQYGMPPIRVETGLMPTTRTPLLIMGGLGLALFAAMAMKRRKG